MKRTDSSWDPATGVLHTRLQGTVTLADVEDWRQGLAEQLARIPDGGQFRLLANLHGFEAQDLTVHKAMRTVIPETLASHGMRPAFIDLFDERPEMAISTERGIRCVGFANVHHDETKMASYESRIGRPDQRFFTDPMAAEAWLRSV